MHEIRLYCYPFNAFKCDNKNSLTCTICKRKSHSACVQENKGEYCINDYESQHSFVCYLCEKSDLTFKALPYHEFTSQKMNEVVTDLERSRILFFKNTAINDP